MANWKSVADKLRSSNGGVAKAVKKTTNQKSDANNILNKMNTAASKMTKKTNSLSSKIGTGKWFK